MAAKVPQSASLKRPLHAEAETADRHGGAQKKIIVAIDPNLLKCSYCYGTLVPPLFQCAKGHTTCSKCCGVSDQESDLELQSGSEPDLDLKPVPDPKCRNCYEWNKCRNCYESKTASRCRAMERVLDGLSVPCAFQQHGCAKVMPYAEKQAHEASCAYRPHCPIAGCDWDGGFFGASLREHVTGWHPGLRRTEVWPGCMTPLKLCRTETTRVLLAGSNCSEAMCLLVVDRNVPSGRALSVIHLKDRTWFTREGPVKYRLEVVGNRKNGVLSLDGVAERVEWLTRKYQASSYLLVPDAIWDAKAKVPVSIQLE